MGKRRLRSQAKFPSQPRQSAIAFLGKRIIFRESSSHEDWVIHVALHLQSKSLEIFPGRPISKRLAGNIMMTNKYGGVLNAVDSLVYLSLKMVP